MQSSNNRAKVSGDRASRQPKVVFSKEQAAAAKQEGLKAGHKKAARVLASYKGRFVKLDQIQGMFEQLQVEYASSVCGKPQAKKVFVPAFRDGCTAVATALAKKLADAGTPLLEITDKVIAEIKAELGVEVKV
jgi:hypothetical protein